MEQRKGWRSRGTRLLSGTLSRGDIRFARSHPSKRGKSSDAAMNPVLTKEATEDALDAAFWEAIKDTQAPDELAAYLEKHPDGHFAALARARLARSVETADDEETPA